ncbi:MAG: acyl-CoA dehydratase activase-related protein [Oscillospiraceae bacterium]
MKIGIPRGLLFHKYGAFAKTFLEELGAETVISPRTNKEILDRGVSACVDEACLPVKLFHGHVSWLEGRCDALFIPRVMGFEEHKYICPMFCGLNEMLRNSIADLPPVIDAPVYSISRPRLLEWAKKAGGMITSGSAGVYASALNKAVKAQAKADLMPADKGFPVKAALLGHSYNISDAYINMDVKKKLNALGVGVFTAERIGCADIRREAEKLFKQPFWTLGREYYGAAVHIYRTKKADGIIYLSSFSCGIDSVVTELIKNEIGDFPFLVLKLDEHTGEAGQATRLEAFSDMLKRRCRHGADIPQYGQYSHSREGPVPGT